MTPKVYARAEDLLASHAIQHITQRGQSLEAEVRGGQLYTVKFLLDDTGFLAEVACNCEYSFGGWCKHQGAVALALATEQTAIEERPTIQALVEQLTPDQLKTIALIWGEANPADLEMLMNHQSKDFQPLGPLRQRVRELIRESTRQAAYGEEELALTEALESLLDQVLACLKTQAIESAYAMLSTITETWAKEGEALHEYLDPMIIGADLDAMWARLILMHMPAAPARAQYQVDLNEWGGYADSAFEMALLALKQGWDDPQLVAVLEGRADTLWPQHDRPQVAQSLAELRLELLQDKPEVYVRFACAEGFYVKAMEMLLHLGQAEAAIAIANSFATWQQARDGARLLHKRGHTAAALSVAEQGLTLPGDPKRVYVFSGDRAVVFEASRYIEAPNRYELYAEASQLAAHLGDRNRALQYQQAAFEAQVSFSDYTRLKTLAAAAWPQYRGAVLAHLDGKLPDHIRIALAEGELDLAIAMVEPYANPASLKLVVSQAYQHRPDWVKQKTKACAEAILKEKKASSYATAIEWLRWYRLASSKADWQAYREDLTQRYKSLRKFMGLLAAMP